MIKVAEVVLDKPKDVYLSPYKAIAGSVVSEVAGVCPNIAPSGGATGPSSQPAAAPGCTIAGGGWPAHTSSATRPSASSGVTRVRVLAPRTSLRMPKWCCACAATCGRCVTHNT